MKIYIEKNKQFRKHHPVDIITDDNKEYHIIRHDNKSWILRYYPNVCTDALYYPYDDITLLPVITPVFDNVIQACLFVIKHHDWMI